jgi:hypothetical protein
LAFTPVWSALAPENARWRVSASWINAWAWPEPPQPQLQPELLDCVWPAPCVVLLELVDPAVAPFVAVWSAAKAVPTGPIPNAATTAPRAINFALMFSS